MSHFDPELALWAEAPFSSLFAVHRKKLPRVAQALVPVPKTCAFHAEHAHRGACGTAKSQRRPWMGGGGEGDVACVHPRKKKAIAVPFCS